MKPVYLFLTMLTFCFSCHMKHEPVANSAPDSLLLSAAPVFSSLKPQLAQKTYHLLTLSETPSEVPFLFSMDSFLQAQDPGAYQLMDNMMRMSDYLQTSDDFLAWVQAVTERIRQYNSRKGFPEDSPEPALTAIHQLMDIYREGSKSELNCAGMVQTTTNQYRLLSSYRTLIEQVDEKDHYPAAPLKLSDLYYQELTEYLAIQQKLEALLNHYTYNIASYSTCLPDMYTTTNAWLTDRYDALSQERLILWSNDPSLLRPFGHPVSDQQFQRLFHYYKTRDAESIQDEMQQRQAKPQLEEPVERLFHFAYLSTVVDQLDTALNHWLDIRDEIAMRLPQPMHAPYRSVTQRLYAGIYDDLVDLQELRF